MKKIWLSLLSVILLFTLTGCSIIKTGSKSPMTAKNLTTVKVERKDIESIVNLSGNVAVDPKITIVSKVSGKVIQLFVEEGDWIEKGDKIIEIDSTVARFNYQNTLNSYNIAKTNYENSENTITQAKANVESAEATYNIAKLNLDIATKTDNSHIQVNQAEEQVKQAEINLENAKNNLSTLGSSEATNTSIKIAELQLNSQELSLAIAQLNLKSLIESGPTDEDIKQAEEQLNQAKINNDTAKERLKESANNPNTPDEEIKILENQILLTESNIKLAELNLDKLNNYESPSEDDIERARYQAEQAKVALQISIENYSQAKISRDNQIKQAENQVRFTESQLTVSNENLNIAKNSASASSDSIEVRKAQLTQAEASLKIAKLNLENAEIQISIDELQMQQAYNTMQIALNNLNDYTITSPISGTILSLYIQEGGTASMGTIAVIGNTENFIAEAFSDEIDVVNIKKGQDALLTFDALPHKEVKGTVEYIGNSTTAVSGIQAYKIKIKIDDSSIVLKDGLSVNVDITTQMKNNVLAVPIESAFYHDGKYYVDVVQSDNTIQRKEVETGISSDDYTEIISGLSEGDTILRVPYNSVFTEVKGIKGMPGGK
ncbi:MAG: efflux RND transporter periplasmic adaptor subunit [Caldisericaceae bacterium]|nr:efflux RND transporter periplasmic adaptor subunit [Caldisericaceae bacterium]